VIAAARSTGMGVRLITHRPVAANLVDRCVELRHGRIRAAESSGFPNPGAAYSAMPSGAR
jgi:ABC-type protease/lipase transport system fused ATPase/permease subunit